MNLSKKALRPVALRRLCMTLAGVAVLVVSCRASEAPAVHPPIGAGVEEFPEEARDGVSRDDTALTESPGTTPSPAVPPISNLARDVAAELSSPAPTSVGKAASSARVSSSPLSLIPSSPTPAPKTKPPLEGDVVHPSGNDTAASTPTPLSTVTSGKPVPTSQPPPEPTPGPTGAPRVMAEPTRTPAQDEADQAAMEPPFVATETPMMMTQAAPSPPPVSVSPRASPAAIVVDADSSSRITDSSFVEIVPPRAQDLEPSSAPHDGPLQLPAENSGQGVDAKPSYGQSRTDVTDTVMGETLRGAAIIGAVAVGACALACVAAEVNRRIRALADADDKDPSLAKHYGPNPLVRDRPGALCR